MVTSEVINLAKLEASKQDLPIDLVLAIIEVESSGNTFAVKYEPNYVWYYRPELFAKKYCVDVVTEKALQRFSYGLMQIMGGTARGKGFEGRFHELFLPSVGLMWGCTYLKAVCDEYIDLEDRIAAYNEGSVKKDSNGDYVNKSYVQKVLDILDHNFENLN